MIEIAGRQGLDVCGDFVAVNQGGIGSSRRGCAGPLRYRTGASRADNRARRRTACTRGRPRAGGGQRRVGNDPDFRQIGRLLLANIAFGANSAAKLTALSKPRRFRRGGDKAA